MITPGFTHHFVIQITMSIASVLTNTRCSPGKALN
jgi:hypothetical protein